MKFKESKDSEFTHKEVFEEKNIKNLDKDLTSIFENENVRSVRVVYQIDEGKFVSKTFSRELQERINSNNETISDFMAVTLTLEGYEDFELLGCEIESYSDI